MLTSKQRDLLIFIHERLEHDGISPSFDEMKDALGLKSKSGVHRLISALEERGFLRRLAHRARALEVQRLPDDYAAKNIEPISNRRVAALQRTPMETMRHNAAILQAGLGENFRPEESRTPFANKSELDAANTNQTVGRIPQSSWGKRGIDQVPMLGKIAAGLPIEAVNDDSLPTIGVPQELKGNGEHFALEVQGDSMIEAGINNGDQVIIRKTDMASNGDIVVAVVEGWDVTLKRLRRTANVVALEPANSRYETKIYPPDQVGILGRLVGLMRTY